jgi:hypothetical protein
MRQNVRLNDLDDKVEPNILNWGTAIPDPLPSTPDIVLAADCVYFEPSFPLLQHTISLFVNHHATVYFCFKKRRRADMRFMKTARKLFSVQEVDDDPDRDIYAKENIFL